MLTSSALPEADVYQWQALFPLFTSEIHRHIVVLCGLMRDAVSLNFTNQKP